MIGKIVKLGSVITHRKEFIIIKDSEEYKRCRVQVNRKGIVLRDIVKGSSINTKKQQLCKTGDFLVAEIDAKVGGYGFVPEDLDGAIVSSHYFLFDVDESKMLSSYLAWLIKTDIIQEQINSKGSTNYAAIRPKNVLEFDVPLPNLDEQAVIIERLESFASRHSTTLTEINQQRVYLQLLRQTILQEAVQGKLTQRDPSDEPASVLLQRIKAEKQKLVKEGKLKKEKELPAIQEEEILFKLPQGWVWCRLAEVCTLITDGTHLTPKYIDKGQIFLSAQNVKPFRFIPQNHRYVSDEDYQTYIKSKKAEKGDILMTRVGAGIGEATVIDIDLNFAFYVSLCLLKPFKNGIFPHYIELYLNSPLGRGHSTSKTLGRGVSAGNLNLNLIRSFELPLPPFEEQQRIVAKVKALQQHFDALEAQMEQSWEQATQLLQAVLKEAFEGEGKDYKEDEPLSIAAEA